MLEREALLVCPGVFANHGRWMGFSVKELIKRSAPLATASKVVFHGRTRHGDRKELFLTDEAKADTVFLAYGVNNTILPRKHGFPLRVVAEGHLVSHWLKFVYKVEFVE
jgi:sulfoxide reductase catalytic subunit YedY